jgi:predicted RNA-binding Zn ribbon-like protein
MLWSATERFALKGAPGRLALIQDWLNTGDPDGRLPGPDLLATLADARAWLAHAATRWSATTGMPAPRFEIDEMDLPHLRQARDELYAAVSSRSHNQPVEVSAPSSHAFEAGVELAPDGTVRLAAKGSGWQMVLSWLLLEIYQSQQEDTWRRLKACKNSRCRGVFYDSSNNNSGVWHDVRTCGNRANLRASRARKSQQLQDH